MKKFDITCRTCGANASIRGADQYDGEERYAGTRLIAVCPCGAEEEIEEAE